MGCRVEKIIQERMVTGILGHYRPLETKQQSWWYVVPFFPQDKSLPPPLAPRNVFLNYFKCPKRALQCRGLEFSSPVSEKVRDTPRGSPGTGPQFLKKPFIKSQMQWGVFEGNEGEC